MSHLAWGAWIEMLSILVLVFSVVASHLAWGAWIEISVFEDCVVGEQCRTSHGVRGLKFLCSRVVSVLPTSHLAWGAWIEIVCRWYRY